MEQQATGVIFPTTPNGKVFDPIDVLHGTAQAFVIALIAITLGTLIDWSFTKASKGLKSKYAKIGVAISQILVLSIITTLLYLVILPKWITDHFQSTYTGLLFPALFYGIQSNIFNTFEAFY